MRVLFFCPRWGQDNLSWDLFLQKVKQAGYDGVETGLPVNEKERQTIIDAIKDYDLQLIAQHWETAETDFDKYKAEYQSRLQFLAAAKPLFINAQTGKDYYSFEQNKTLIQLAAEIALQSGVQILHETHRGKFSFAAHIMQTYLQKIKGLRITLDISHWFNVAESMLQDQQTAVDLAIAHTHHIHARVGHTQGPQIMDPRAPEFSQIVDAHLACWDKVVAKKRSLGAEYFTITPEFGDVPYLPLLPYTQQPIVSQWDINKYMMDILRQRYSAPTA